MVLLASFLLVGLYQIFFPNYFRLGPFRIYPLDFVYFFMILRIGRYALTHRRSMAKLIRENFFLMAFLAMVAFYVIVYTPIYGQSAIGEARKFYFAFLFPLLALISIKSREDLRRLFLLLVIVAFCTVLVGLAKLGMQGNIVKVLNAEATLTLALVALAMLVHQVNKTVIVSPLLDRVLLLLFSVLVIGSGQRSCWLAVGFGLMLTLLLYRYRAILLSKMFMLGLAGLMAVTAGLIMFPEAASRLIERFGGIINPYEDPNASWRIAAWQDMWDTVKQNLFFGEGIGGYYSWEFKGSERTASPHNAYLQMMLKFGLFGLSLYSLLAIQFFRKTLRVRRKLRPGPMKTYIELSILTFGAVHAYMLGYGIHPFALTFLGMGICAAKLAEQSSRQHQTVRAGTDQLRQSTWSIRAGRRSKERPFLTVE
jgi:O-antigen ligase